jgi:hypothetical protein
MRSHPRLTVNIGKTLEQNPGHVQCRLTSGVSADARRRRWVQDAREELTERFNFGRVLSTPARQCWLPPFQTTSGAARGQKARRGL